MLEPSWSLSALLSNSYVYLYGTPLYLKSSMFHILITFLYQDEHLNYVLRLDTIKVF